MILSLEIIFRSGNFSTCPSAAADKHKRTAVLVIHGIGSQRALETVRGVIQGVWLDGENPYDDGQADLDAIPSGTAPISISR